MPLSEYKNAGVVPARDKVSLGLSAVWVIGLGRRALVAF